MFSDLWAVADTFWCTRVISIAKAYLWRLFTGFGASEICFSSQIFLFSYFICSFFPVGRAFGCESLLSNAGFSPLPPSPSHSPVPITQLAKSGLFKSCSLLPWRKAVSLVCLVQTGTQKKIPFYSRAILRKRMPIISKGFLGSPSPFPGKKKKHRKGLSIQFNCCKAFCTIDGESGIDETNAFPPRCVSTPSLFGHFRNVFLCHGVNRFWNGNVTGKKSRTKAATCQADSQHYQGLMGRYSTSNKRMYRNTWRVCLKKHSGRIIWQKRALLWAMAIQNDLWKGVSGLT